MNQFAGLDVKIQFSDNIAKRVKMPMTFAELSQLVSSVAKAKGLDTSTPTIQYTDAENESVVVEDDVDLEMAYTIAHNYMDKRIKFSVIPGQSCSSSQAPSTAVTEVVQMQPQQD